MYAIVDIETTGGRPDNDRITEIAIIIHDGEKVVETLSILINPECSVPYNITMLTGISNEMVREGIGDIYLTINLAVLLFTPSK